MAKKIKFPLKLKDDFQVRTLEELKEHFDLDKIVAYFLDGKLLIWLKARYYEPEIKAVRSLRKNDSELQKKLCQIFGVEYSDYQLDINEVEERNRRLGILRQFTSDPTVLEQVASVAFNQEDLGDLIDDGVQKIFLCNNSFVIPLSIENKTYIGIGKTTAVIRSNTEIDFKSKHIEFINVNFDNDYAKIVTKQMTPSDTSKTLVEKGNLAKENGDYESAFNYYMKAVDFDNGEAMDRIAELYNEGLGVPKDDAIAYKWYKKSAEAGFPEGMNDFAFICHWGQTPSGTPDNQQALEWFKKAGDAGFFNAYNQVGWFYQNGIGTYQNYTEAIRWYEKAANHGVLDGFNNLAWLYDHGMGVAHNHNKAMEYYRTAANGGNLRALLNLGTILFQDGKCREAENYFNEAIKQNSEQAYNMLGVIQEINYHQLHIAKQCYESAGNLGDVDGMFNAGRLYEKENNFSKAFYWYEQAANKNNVYAIYSVGRFYNNGFGVTRNTSLAEKYYLQAANMGLDLAKSAYQRFQKQRSYTDYSDEIMWGGPFEPTGLTYD